MKHVLLFLLMVGFFASVQAQKDEENALFLNSEKIDDDRYKEMKGSPYLFENWVTGTIIDLDKKTYPVSQINYNGYTQEFEVRKGDSFITLDEKAYLRVELDWKGEKMIYQRGLDRFRPNTFIQVLYKGEDMKLIKDFKVKLVDVTIQNVGKTIDVKRFTPTFTYSIAKKGKLEDFKLKKKNVVKLFGSEIEQYSKKNKVNLGTEEGLVAALKGLEN